MSKEEIREKITSCKALQGMTVAELIGTDRFRENLAKYMKAQFEDRRAIQQSYAAMQKMGGAKGYKLPAHPIDRVIGYTVGEFAAEYMAILNKQSNLPASVRLYIKQLGDQSYSLTVIQYVVDEYPELADELLPKSKAN